MAKLFTKADLTASDNFFNIVPIVKIKSFSYYYLEAFNQLNSPNKVKEKFFDQLK